MVKNNIKKQPNLSFLIDIPLSFSLSIDYETAEKFKLATANNNADAGQTIRGFIWELLGVKDKKEFLIRMDKPIKLLKEEIYTGVGVTRTNFFSKIIEEKIRKYIAEHPND